MVNACVICGVQYTLDQTGRSICNCNRPGKRMRKEPTVVEGSSWHSVGVDLFGFFRVERKCRCWSCKKTLTKGSIRVGKSTHRKFNGIRGQYEKRVWQSWCVVCALHYVRRVQNEMTVWESELNRRLKE